MYHIFKQSCAEKTNWLFAILDLFSLKPTWIRKLLGALVLCFFALTVFSQTNTERMDLLNQKIDVLEQNGVLFSEAISISLDGSIQEMANLLTESSNINLSIPSSVNAAVSVNFKEASVRDIVLYLCDSYNLDLRVTGAIIQLIPYQAKKVVRRALDIDYETGTGLLSMDLVRDSLGLVAKAITKKTGQNIIVDPSIRNKQIDAYIEKATVQEALQQIASNNDLLLEEQEGEIPLLKKKENVAAGGNTTTGGFQITADQLSIELVGDDQVNIRAQNAPVIELIKQTAARLNAEYLILPERDITSVNRNNRGGSNSNQNNIASSFSSNDLLSLQLEAVSFEEVLQNICKNSTYSYTIENDILIIGKRNATTLSNVRIIRMQNRSAKGVVQYIPDQIKENVVIDTLLEQNSLILSGEEEQILEIESFLSSIDKAVPLIMIELIIIDVQKSTLREIGIEAGIINGGVTSEGQVASEGGIDFTFSADAINDLLNLLLGQNIINLGQVSSNFYLNLKALEERGVVEIQSTPKLSTLNSHFANLSIGQTRYYLEQQLSYPGNDRPIAVQSNTYQSVEANLDIEILPIVSGNDEVTLEIFFEQSEFIGDPPPNAPPAQVSRKFDSIIRVKNGEMVVLGGLERESKSKVNRGIPVLSRIPVLGWLFGKKRKSKSEEKLMIFVKPTIVK